MPAHGNVMEAGAAHASCSSTCQLLRMQDPLEATEHHSLVRKIFVCVGEM